MLILSGLEIGNGSSMTMNDNYGKFLEKLANVLIIGMSEFCSYCISFLFSDIELGGEGGGGVGAY